MIPMHGPLSNVVSNLVASEQKMISGAQPLLLGSLEVCRNYKHVYFMHLRLPPVYDSP